MSQLPARWRLDDLLPSGRRISYETRLAARQRYEQWEQGIQQAQFQNAVPQGYEQQLAAPGIVAGGCLEWELLAQVSEEQWMALPQNYRQRLVEGLGMPRIRRQEWDWGQANSRPEKRSLALLRRHLTDEQWQTLSQHGFFKVAGRMRRLGRWQNHLFTVHQHCMIYEHLPKGRQHYCIVAMEPGMPDFDWMLMVKMLIESDLRKFYDTAKKRGFNPAPAGAGCNQLDL